MKSTDSLQSGTTETVVLEAPKGGNDSVYQRTHPLGCSGRRQRDSRHD